LEVTLRDKQPHLLKKKSTLIREKKFSVLIADDNSFNILIITKFLQKLPGFKISPHIACNGKKALEIFEEVNKSGAYHPIKIIYMDCKMPVMNGFEATREIRSLASKGTHYDPVIIGLTSFIGEEERDLAIQSGMNDIHLKPITESDFIEITLNYANRLMSSKSFGD
jgi:CheY-like chemotaxis protein